MLLCRLFTMVIMYTPDTGAKKEMPLKSIEKDARLTLGVLIITLPKLNRVLADNSNFSEFGNISSFDYK
ncbi:hypothetical protein NC652_018177 [Populus alba x Populus x berolinensis]|nr:hypothetical protein NC652_018177 [Populus alba x Populus x berolinensis]